MRRPTAEIVLASASPRRVELLASAGIVVNVVPSGIPEELRPGETPDEHVRRLAAEKVRAVAASHPGRFFIGADTVVVLGGEVLGKPRGYVMDLGTLWRFAAHWYDGRLDRGYVRREPAQAAEYLRSVGLSGPFWGL